MKSDHNTSVRDLPKACEAFSCGTTAATNVILERRTAKMVWTTGFRDVLRIREGSRENNYEIFEDYPEPLIPDN